MVSRNQIFLVVCMVSFVGICTGYFLLIDCFLVPQHAVPKSYRHFMLQASTTIPERIVVESGSNAIHAIDIGMLEAATGYAGFNIADTAGYPFQHKVYRLRSALNAGDVVILPLEWVHYADSAVLNGNYVNSLVDGEAVNAFYYHGLPFWRRLQFAFLHLPYKLAVESMMGRAKNAFDAAAQRAALDRDLKNLRDRIEEGDRGSSYDSSQPPLERLTDAMRCSSYLFGVFGERFSVSDTFLENLALLRQVQSETGARLIFTWPAVVAKNDDPCYRAEIQPLLASHASEVKSLVEAAGFEFVGDYRDSEYSSECMRDTFYHIKHECAVERTALLIDQLADMGVAGEDTPRREEVSGALLDAWSELARQVEGSP